MFYWFKIDLILNNLQWFICHKTQTNGIEWIGLLMNLNLLFSCCFFCCCCFFLVFQIDVQYLCFRLYVFFRTLMMARMVLVTGFYSEDFLIGGWSFFFFLIPRHMFRNILLELIVCENLWHLQIFFYVCMYVQVCRLGIFDHVCACVCVYVCAFTSVHLFISMYTPHTGLLFFRLSCYLTVLYVCEFIWFRTYMF